MMIYIMNFQRQLFLHGLTEYEDRHPILIRPDYLLLFCQDPYSTSTTYEEYIKWFSFGNTPADALRYAEKLLQDANIPLKIEDFDVYDHPEYGSNNKYAIVSNKTGYFLNKQWLFDECIRLFENSPTGRASRYLMPEVVYLRDNNGIFEESPKYITKQVNFDISYDEVFLDNEIDDFSFGSSPEIAITNATDLLDRLYEPIEGVIYQSDQIAENKYCVWIKGLLYTQYVKVILNKTLIEYEVERLRNLKIYMSRFDDNLTF